jgi:hypothetical protein
MPRKVLCVKIMWALLFHMLCTEGRKRYVCMYIHMNLQTCNSNVYIFFCTIRVYVYMYIYEYTYADMWEQWFHMLCTEGRKRFVCKYICINTHL